jgi:hypothetical protein
MLQFLHGVNTPHYEANMLSICFCDIWQNTTKKKKLTQSMAAEGGAHNSYDGAECRPMDKHKRC